MLFFIYQSCHIFILFHQNLCSCLPLPTFYSISANLLINILFIKWLNSSISALILHVFISIIRFNTTQYGGFNILKILLRSTITFFLEYLLTLTIINYIYLIPDYKRCMLFANQWLWYGSISPTMINNWLFLTLSIKLLWLVYRLICPIWHVTSRKTIWLNWISMECLHIPKCLLSLILKFIWIIMVWLDSLLIFIKRLILFLSILLLTNNLLYKTLRYLASLLLFMLLFIQLII